MTSSTPSGVMTAILPCNDLDATERFYRRLGFTRCASQWPPPDEPDTCRLLSNGGGGYLHLTDAVEGWLVPGRNPFGLYLYLEDVDALAAEFQDEILGKHAPEGKASGGQGFRRTRLPEDKAWGMYEFAVCDPQPNAGSRRLADAAAPISAGNWEGFRPTAASRFRGPAS
jgi:hypothetical protein